MGLYLNGVGQEVVSSGDFVSGVGKTPKWMRKIGPYVAGGASVIAFQKLLSPGLKNLYAKYKAARKAARTRREQKEAARIRKLLMQSSPEIFQQRAGYPSPAEIQTMIERSRTDQPVVVKVVKPATDRTQITRGLRLPPRPVPEVAEPKKITAEKALTYGALALLALKLTKAM